MIPAMKLRTAVKNNDITAFKEQLALENNIIPIACILSAIIDNKLEIIKIVIENNSYVMLQDNDGKIVKLLDIIKDCLNLATTQQNSEMMLYIQNQIRLNKLKQLNDV